MLPHARCCLWQYFKNTSSLLYRKKSFIFLFEANVIFLYFDCSSRLTCLSSTYNTQHFLLFQCDSTRKGLRESKFSHTHAFSNMSLKYVTEIKKQYWSLPYSQLYLGPHIMSLEFSLFLSIYQFCPPLGLYSWAGSHCVKVYAAPGLYLTSWT